MILGAAGGGGAVERKLDCIRWVGHAERSAAVIVVPECH
jgi:hypothetical protein